MLAACASQNAANARDANPAQVVVDQKHGLVVLASAMGSMVGDRGRDIAAPVAELIADSVRRGGALAEALRDANRWLLDGAKGEREGQAASVAAARLVRNAEEIEIVNIGNTRIASCQKGALRWVALDDTEIVCEHVLTTRALGLDDVGDIDPERIAWRAEDRVLLCSAAIYRSIGQAALGHAVADGAPEAAAASVVHGALSSGREQHASCAIILATPPSAPTAT